MIKIYTDSTESLVELNEACSIPLKNKVVMPGVVTGAFLDFKKTGEPLFLREVILNGECVYFTEELISKLFNGETGFKIAKAKEN